MCTELSEALIAQAAVILLGHPDVFKLATGVSVEAAGSLLGERAEPNVEDASGRSPVWRNLKRQFYVLLCTDGGEYASIREQVRDVNNVTKTIILPAIAAAIGGSINVEAGVLTPFVALIVLGIARVGRNAWCDSARSANGTPSFGGSQIRSSS